MASKEAMGAAEKFLAWQGDNPRERLPSEDLSFLETIIDRAIEARCVELVEALEGVTEELSIRMRRSEIPGRVALRRAEDALAKFKGDS